MSKNFKDGESVYVRGDDREWKYYKLPRASLGAATTYLRDTQSISDRAVVGAIQISPDSEDGEGCLVVIYSSKEEMKKYHRRPKRQIFRYNDSSLSDMSLSDRILKWF